MKLLVQSATIQCTHGAPLQLSATQNLVTINGQPVLAQPSPAGGAFVGCANNNPQAGLKPCISPLPAMTGYSLLVKINGQAAATDALAGMTDSTAPAQYRVAQAGQSFVATVS